MVGLCGGSRSCLIAASIQPFGGPHLEVLVRNGVCAGTSCTDMLIMPAYAVHEKVFTVVHVSPGEFITDRDGRIVLSTRRTREEENGMSCALCMHVCVRVCEGRLLVCAEMDAVGTHIYFYVASQPC